MEICWDFLLQTSLSRLVYGFGGVFWLYNVCLVSCMYIVGVTVLCSNMEYLLRLFVADVFVEADVWIWRVNTLLCFKLFFFCRVPVRFWPLYTIIEIHMFDQRRKGIKLDLCSPGNRSHFMSFVWIIIETSLNTSVWKSVVHATIGSSYCITTVSC